MARKFIGIDIGSREVRVAVATEEKGTVSLLRTTKSPAATAAEAAAAVREILGEDRRFGDRLAGALPASESFVRWLTLPFADSRKIEAVFSFELSSQIPAAMEECIADFQLPPAAAAGEAVVPAAAVGLAAVRPLVETFDRENLSLHVIDLAPFAYAVGLRHLLQDALLVCLGENEATVALVRSGQVVDFRLLATVAPSAAALVDTVLMSGLALQKAARCQDLPLLLLGPGVTPEVREELSRRGQPFTIPAVSGREGSVEPEFLPAVALAFRAALPEKFKAFNFRRGPFALKSEWAVLKRSLAAAGVLLVLAAAALAGSAYLNYAFKARRAEALQAEMVKIYRETFPGPGAIVDIPLQMRSRVEELKKKGRLGAIGADASPLPVLLEISRQIPGEIPVDLRDLSFTPGEMRLEGSTNSFESVNRMARALGQSARFKEAKIADAKMSLDGRQVDFRLQLTLAQPLEQP